VLTWANPIWEAEKERAADNARVRAEVLENQKIGPLRAQHGVLSPSQEQELAAQKKKAIAEAMDKAKEEIKLDSILESIGFGSKTYYGLSFTKEKAK
jgi:hypothetical protein